MQKWATSKRKKETKNRWISTEIIFDDFVVFVVVLVVRTLSIVKQ